MRREGCFANAARAVPDLVGNSPSWGRRHRPADKLARRRGSRQAKPTPRLAASLFLLVLVVSIVFSSAPTAGARELRLATWNIAWLTFRPPGHPDLPQGFRPRTEDDLRRLRAYAEELSADVVALQEVDGPLAAARVFDSRAWDFHFADERDVQRVGFAVRRGVAWRANPDLVELDLVSHARLSLRRGADITVSLAGRDLRLLSIHLRGGCVRDDLDDPQRPACVQLRRQAEILAAWVAAREREGAAYAILGDFNRRLADDEGFWRILTGPAALTRVTEGASPCWGRGRPFIDHIVLGGEARAWFVPNSLSVLVYREREAEVWEDRLSDHCPVRATLDLARAVARDGRPVLRWLWPFGPQP